MQSLHHALLLCWLLQVWLSAVLVVQMAMYSKLGYSKDESSPYVDLEEPHGYTILSKFLSKPVAANIKAS